MLASHSRSGREGREDRALVAEAGVEAAVVVVPGHGEDRWGFHPSGREIGEPTVLRWAVQPKSPLRTTYLEETKVRGPGELPFRTLASATPALCAV